MGQIIEKIQQWFYSKTLKQKIRFLFLLLAITCITIFLFIYYFFIKQNMTDYMLESNYNSMISIGNNLNVEMQAVSSMSQLIMTNNNVSGYLKAPKGSQSSLSYNAIRSIYDINNMFNYISSIYVFRNDKHYINISKEFTYVNMNVINSPEWQKEIIEKSGSYIIRVNGNGAFNRKTGEPVLSFIRLINDIDTQTPIGFIAINLNIDVLKNSLKDMTSEDRYFGYYDNSQNVLFQSKEIETFKEINMTEKNFEQISKQKLGVTEIASYYHIPNTPFILGEVEEVSFFKYISPQAIMIIIIIMILSVICLVIIGIFISVFIERPIERLTLYMDTVKSSWNKKGIMNKDSNNNKIGDLQKNNSKLVEVNRIMNELLNKEKEMRKAELEVLQEQINPHFLYNTLGTIADLALQISADEIYDAIETLGNFYRKFLSKGSKEISIREEIGIIKDYLKLQKLRYQDVFEDEYDLQEDLLDIKVPKLILQPLVENSLYHGVRLKGDKGIIKISVFSKDKKVHIEVYDTGIGMNPEQIDAILREDNKKSFGFKKTMERIRYYFNTADVVEIESEEGVYCKIDIKIPLQGEGHNV